MKTATRYRIYKIIIVLALAAYTIKNLFVGMDADEGYGVVAGFRLAMGDKLVLEMWEPHQTSAIFTAILEKPWLLLMGGKAEFLDLYLKVIFFIIHSLITLFIYRTLKKCAAGMDSNAALLMALIFYVTSPKSIFIPEYSNLHIWFFMLLSMTFMRYYAESGSDRGKIIWLVLAGLCLTGDVLSYPSMVLLLPVCLIFILKKHIKKAFAEMTAFVMPCLVCFAAFMLYLLSYMSPELLLELIPYVLSDGSHQTDYLSRCADVAGDFGIMAIVIAASALFAYILGKIIIRMYYKKHVDEPEKDNVAVYAAVFLALQMAFQIVQIFISRYSGSYPHITYIAASLLGIFFYLRGGRREKAGFYMIVFSALSYAGVILMSNWGPLNLNIYMVGGVLGGFICMYGYFREKAGSEGVRAVRALCALLIITNVFGYCYLIIGGEDSHSPIYTIGGYGHGGVKAGIIASWMASYRYNTNLELWPEAVPDGSTVLYVGPSQFFYMLGDCTIAAPNTISTPVYNENLLKYWEFNPDRYPNVIAVESWYGDTPHYGEESFIMQWIENDFGYTRKEEYPYVTVYYR
ncbi:MAG: glycosyltransferase family 39 protein [Lachnospiraceae bacterium]|nr:glycosyltransferase family 39 protein [Lachnospiraceae bacterium]